MCPFSQHCQLCFALLLQHRQKYVRCSVDCSQSLTAYQTKVAAAAWSSSCTEASDDSGLLLHILSTCLLSSRVLSCAQSVSIASSALPSSCDKRRGFELCQSSLSALLCPLSATRHINCCHGLCQSSSVDTANQTVISLTVQVEPDTDTGNVSAVLCPLSWI